jgi:hypothetical protein
VDADDNVVVGLAVKELMLTAAAFFAAFAWDGPRDVESMDAAEFFSTF